MAVAPTANSLASAMVGVGVFKEAAFCGISPLGAYLDDETKEKMWKKIWTSTQSIGTETRR